MSWLSKDENLAQLIHRCVRELMANMRVLIYESNASQRAVGQICTDLLEIRGKLTEKSTETMATRHEQIVESLLGQIVTQLKTISTRLASLEEDVEEVDADVIKLIPEAGAVSATLVITANP